MEQFFCSLQNLSFLDKIGWRPAEKNRILYLDFYDDFYQSKFWSAANGSSSSSWASGARPAGLGWCLGGSGGGSSGRNESSVASSALRLAAVDRSSLAGSLGGCGDALPASGSPDAMSWDRCCDF
jgi:hypothetical protein